MPKYYRSDYLPTINFIMSLNQEEIDHFLETCYSAISHRSEVVKLKDYWITMEYAKAIINYLECAGRSPIHADIEGSVL